MSQGVFARLLHFLLKQIPHIHPNMNVNKKVKRNVASMEDTTASISVLSFTSVPAGSNYNVMLVLYIIIL